MVKKVLVIDGGGMYGVVPLEVCIAIEEAAPGKQLKDIFDLFVGTSTGALIAASAVAGLKGPQPFGLPAKTIMDQYEELGTKIFSAKNTNIKVPGVDLHKYPEYNAQALRLALNNVIGEKKMGDYDQELSISAYNMTKAKPHFFRSWGETQPEINQNLYLRDAVMASSSAPTYHPLHQIGGDDGDYYTDGGVFATNPAFFALGDALTLPEIAKNEKVILVSLGTGIEEFRPDTDTANVTLSWWAKHIADAILDGQNESTHQVMTQIAETTDWLEYFRFNVNLKKPKKADETDFDGTLKEARDLMRKALDNEYQAEFAKMMNQLLE